jgi:glycosyltransferase involved in cell wall biosynthesis
MATATLPISAFIICKNEQASIGQCLESLRSCAEIVVVDSGSEDSTLEIVEAFVARGFPIRLIRRDWPGYALQKQFALEQTTQPWALSVDADEWLDRSLCDALPALIAVDESVAGWRLPRADMLYGYCAPARGVHRKPILRLVRRGRARFDTTRLVHEGLIVDGRVRDERRGFLHHERSLAIQDQMLKEIAYARLKATERVRAGKRPSVLKLLFNPLITFLRMYVLQRFFLCGRAGLIHAGTTSTYAFLTEAIHHQMDRDKRRVRGDIEGDPSHQHRTDTVVPDP